MIHVLALIAALGSPVAGKACPSMADVIGVLESDGTRYTILPAEDVQAFVDEIAEPIARIELDHVTNVLIAVLNGRAVFGLEVDGCMGNPIPLPMPEPAVHRSGRDKDGSVWA